MTLKLDLSERITPLSPKIINQIKKACADINCYPREDDYNKTLALLTKYTGIKSENILITHGSHHGLEVIFFLFNEKDEVLIPSPAFSLFKKFEEYKKFKVKKIYYNQNFEIEVDKIIKAISPQTKAIYLVNPQNPLSVEMKKTDILKIIKAAKTKNILVIVDEAYYEFSGITAKDYLKDYDNLIISRSFSKSFGIASTKFGYIMANPKLTKELEHIRGPLFGMSRLSVVAARCCLENMASMKNYVKNIQTAKMKLEKFFSKEGIRYFKSGGNFMVIKTEDAKKLAQVLAQKNIFVKYIGDYPDNNGILENCIRLSIPPLDKINFFCRALKASLPKTATTPLKSHTVVAAKSVR